MSSTGSKNNSRNKSRSGTRSSSGSYKSTNRKTTNRTVKRGNGRAKSSARRRRAQRRNKNIIIGIIIIAVIALAGWLIYKLAGNFGAMPAVSTMTFKEDGSIVYEEIGVFDEAHYNASEAKTFTNEIIDEYNINSIGQITLNKYRTKDNTVYIRTTYTDCNTYADFTGYDSYNGLVNDYLQSGMYCPDESVFVENSDKKLVAVSQNIAVKVPGNIVYVSSERASVEGDTVLIAGEEGKEDVADTVFIIYE